MYEKDIASFLTFGYFLDYRKKPVNIPLSGSQKADVLSMPYKRLIALGVDLFRKAVANCVHPGAVPVVPLSGGLDSRAILAALLEHLEARAIQTYTFGIPEAYDYRFGNRVAAYAGTRHRSFNLNEYRLTTDELIEVSRRIGHQTVLFHHPPYFVLSKEFLGAEFWSGYMGDPLAGSHLPEIPVRSRELAIDRFIAANLYARSHRISCEAYIDRDEIAFPAESRFENLSLEEQLDFENRQKKFVAPHVLMQGFTYRLPFLDENFVSFMLALPRRYRYRQKLYCDILKAMNRRLFSIATKTYHGAGLTAGSVKKRLYRIRHRTLQKTVYGRFIPNPSLNYLDFDRALRIRPDFINIFSEHIDDLARRKIVPWADPRDIWRQHRQGKNLFNVLNPLCSLEIHLKAGMTR